MKKWMEIFEGKEPKPEGGKLSYDFQVVYGAINDPSGSAYAPRADHHIQQVRQTLEDFKKDLDEIGLAGNGFEDLEKHVKNAIERVSQFIEGEDFHITQIDAHTFWFFVESQFTGQPTRSLYRMAKEFEQEYKLRLS